MTGTTTTPTTLDAERADLLAELADARNMLINTVRGLTDEQAGQKPTVSALCLGGLIKHVASTEEAWLRFVVEGPSVMSFAMPEGVTWEDFMSGRARELPQWAIDRGRDFQMLPEDTLPAILDRYARIAARTEEIVAGVEDLSATWPVPDAPWNEPGSVRSVRRVLIHVIAETTQHAGHADILRESIDGQTTT
ncbi:MULTISPECIES: DinB family protein [Micromonospora]|uniref:DinB family protein n=1 Tax=Micromonospora tulbaghiae TaxID=479978 RepID=A0A386WH96_9ACTN|nr:MULTISPECIES: DinB family protein [Micromonospora]AYF27705.1 DinB family protein [Micromonospora tulbaghiae]MDG4751548.1 DinB family protein [Micromonospora sp. WMMD718]